MAWMSRSATSRPRSRASPPASTSSRRLETQRDPIPNICKPPPAGVARVKPFSSKLTAIREEGQASRQSVASAHLSSSSMPSSGSSMSPRPRRQSIARATNTRGGIAAFGANKLFDELMPKGATLPSAMHPPAGGRQGAPMSGLSQATTASCLARPWVLEHRTSAARRLSQGRRLERARGRKSERRLLSLWMMSCLLNHTLPADEDNQIKFWDVDNTNMLTCIEADRGLASFPRLRFSKEGNLLAVTTVDNGFKIRENSDGLRSLWAFGNRPFEAFRSPYEASGMKVLLLLRASLLALAKWIT